MAENKKVDGFHEILGVPEKDLVKSMKLHLCSTFKEYEEVRRQIKTVEDAMSEKYDKPSGKGEDIFDSSSEDEPVTLKELNYIDYGGPMVVEGISDTDHSESESQPQNTSSMLLCGGTSINTPSTMCGGTSADTPSTMCGGTSADTPSTMCGGTSADTPSTMCGGISTNTPTTTMCIGVSTNTPTTMYVDASTDTPVAMHLGASSDPPSTANCKYLEAILTDTRFFSKNKPTSKNKSRGEKSLGSNKPKKVSLKEKVDRFLDKYWLEKFNELKKRS